MKYKEMEYQLNSWQREYANNNTLCYICKEEIKNPKKSEHCHHWPKTEPPECWCKSKNARAEVQPSSNCYGGELKRLYFYHEGALVHLDVIFCPHCGKPMK
ncbi:MAG: hypothetical protein O8C67_07065 [Candidatus Methanoperedens sp.]|nr:hypothetical protein [Candidatus Methanoperedens sp.]